MSRAEVVVLDPCTRAAAAELSARAWHGETPIIPVRRAGALTLIGPALHPGASTCLDCAEQTPHGAPAASGWYPQDAAAPAQRAALDALLAEAVADPCRLDGVVWSVHTGQMSVATHRVRPAPQGCPTCSALPADSAEAAAFDLAAVPAAHPYAYRADSSEGFVDAVRGALVDEQYGPVLRLRRGERAPLAVVRAELAGDGGCVTGYGRTFADAERIALLRAAERYTGAMPHARRTSITAAYADLDPATTLDPTRLGLHDPVYVGQPGFDLTTYTVDTATEWVHAWSLTHARPTAVPEHVAYAGRPGAIRFLAETPNGCGTGASLTEAILQGLFALAGADAALMAWYARTPLRRVAIPAGDPLLPHLADRLETCGYDLLFFDATNDVAIPAVVALALASDPNSGLPQALFAAVAHPDPLSAMRCAAGRVALDVLGLPDAVQADPGWLDRGRLLRCMADPRLVLTAADHVALHSLPEARRRYGFLLGSPEEADPRELWPADPVPADDLTQLLGAILDRLAGCGMEVVVVDQTDPVLRRRAGLYSAKVIVPGSLPLTFGHMHRRTRGLRRLLEVPHGLGRAPAPLRHGDLDLYPHPFGC